MLGGSLCIRAFACDSLPGASFAPVLDRGPGHRANLPRSCASPLAFSVRHVLHDAGPLAALSTEQRAGSLPLRTWQTQALAQLDSWREGPFLLSAAPGAGKTRPALELARKLLSQRVAQQVAVLCPTAPLTRQWASAAAALGLQLQPDASGPRPPRDFHGVCVTYARIASDPLAWRKEVSPQTLVIADEAHHLGEELAWGTGFQAAFVAAPRRLLLSGTPFRSDATPIPGVRYDEEGLARPDFSYTYAQATADGICRPVAFVTFDGSLSWRSGEDVIESSFETVLSTREAGRRYRTAISTELPHGLPRILREADQRLRSLRTQGGHHDAGALAVAADSAHAREICKLITQASGRSPVLVLHTDARASQKLEAFRRSRDPWVVAVNMVSEGVDIPRLRVGVYASAAKTPLIFRQIVGRFVRTLPGRPPEPSWVYLPADPLLRTHASEVESELRHALRARQPDEELFEEPETRRQSERSESADFVPLSAEFAPQMTLFGPAPMTRTTAPTAIPVPEAPAARAAFERRESLRQERSRLVADLQRRDGRSHREINAWLNRAVGISRVDGASIEQLERSVQTLIKELTRQSRRGRRG
jgi:superfamily II DNA or RNA helicase